MSKQNKYAKKRKRGLDVDTTMERRKTTENEEFGGDAPRSRSNTPPKRSRRKGQRQESPDANGGNKMENAESLSIEETNKLRAQLGLAPLEVDTGPQIREGDNEDEKIVVEDGVEIHHRAAKSLTEEKQNEKIKERLEIQAQKRKVYPKILKVKPLADSDSEDDSASAWVEKNRRLEEDRRKAQEKAKELDEMDETFGVGGIVEEIKRNPKKIFKPRHGAKPVDLLTAGLTVGHSKEEFVGGTETILVLADKDVLAEDDEEMLINPNLVDKERLKQNLEKKKKKTDYNPYEDETDEYGMIKKQNLLSKYDEDLDGPIVKETFKLDESGGYNLEKETYEQEMKRKLFMADKKMISLETSKFQIAREYYTEEEMVAFRKPKKPKEGKKIRNRQKKGLKADELEPQHMETQEEKSARAAKLAARRREQAGGEQNLSEVVEVKTKSKAMEVEDGELPEDLPNFKEKNRFKNTMGGTVDTNRIKNLAIRLAKDESDSEEEDINGDEFLSGANVTGIQINDDAEEELGIALERARKLKQQEKKSENEKDTAAEVVRNKLKAYGEIKKEEEMEIDEDEENKNGIIIDSTSEYYKNIGEIPTFGLAGNRDDDVDYSELLEEQERIAKDNAAREKEKRKYSDVEESDDSEDERRKHKKRRQKEIERGAWVRAEDDEEPEMPTTSRKHRDSELSNSKRYESDSEEDEDTTREYKNVLGEEKDVSKGVGAMLKLAAEKGYLEKNKKKHAGGLLKHLESKMFSKVEQGRYDIEDKYVKKLERMGTTGTGPVRSFPEKADYNPQIEISYTDQKGRDLEPKEAFRVLSWKFHGKGPGKKQIEKRQAKLEKKEKLKKMNSMDTPLGTLAKQLKKQEQLQTPFLVLSGNRNDSGAPLTKE